MHRYRVFACAGTHVTFCGTYMARFWTFFNVADAACLLETASDCPPRLGQLVVLSISRPVLGSDVPAMSFPVYPLPSGMVLMPVSCSPQTILAPV